MEIKKKITIINYSSALAQKDVIECNQDNMVYYDTQKGALINQLIEKIDNVSIHLIGFNTTFATKIEKLKNRTYIKLPNISIPFLSVIIFNISSFIYMIVTPKPSLVYVYSNGESCYYFGALLYTKLLRIPIFLCIRNPPEYLITFKKLNYFTENILTVIDKFFFKHVDKIVHISSKSKELLKSDQKLYKKSIVMESCANDIFLKLKTRRNVRNKELIFAYWGIIDEARGLDIVIEGFIKAKELNNKFKAKFYLFGDGKSVERLQKFTTDKKAFDVIFKGYVEQKDLVNDLYATSVALVPIPPKEIFQFSSPLKLAEAVTLELPVIASNIEPNQIVHDKNLGILCNHDVDSYAQAFVKFWEYSDVELDIFSDNCRKIKSLFTPEKQCSEVISAIMNTIQERTNI